ncbi:ABC transporter substrate-binding protein [Candidatus Marinarcus aquaticus]|uniref:histidine kinase n=1 Tax=Candidatus Marinarcus aquaticus TaxID=2044504 RepID=A0A4Q0XT39_9BACT|nr:ABC transporter substrate-binding protein [Candidatus Marinarcus aquaticus]RXJ57581.1 hypothetical protein CRV04_07150 [Candidatus Marinarcus aquaticus]
MRLLLFLFSLFLFTFAYAAQDVEKIKLQLNWKYQFEFAGFIAAKEKGFYKEMGLDVELIEFSNQDIIQDLKSHEVTYALYDLSLLAYLDEQMPVVLLANYFKRSALIFVAQQDIITPYDLRNKIIMASHNELTNSVLGTLLNKFRITQDQYTYYPHNFGSKEFIDGKVDVMSAYISNELFELQKAGKPYNIIDPINYGINGLGSNLFATQEEIQKDPIKAKKFLDATKKGWQYALKNKEEMVDIIYKKYSQHKSKEALLFEANEVEKLIMPEIYKMGEIDKTLLKKNIFYFINSENSSKKIDLDKLIFELNVSTNEIDTSIFFTPQEKAYAEEKKVITMCIDPDWMPYEKLENGEHIGMTSDYMRLIESKIGMSIKLIPTKTWTQSIEYAKQRRCDILSLAMKTKSREKYLNFTEPYLTFPLVVATRNDQFFIPNVKDVIAKETLAIVRNYAFTEILKQKYPDNRLLEVSSVREGLKLVSQGKVFGFVGTLATVGYELQNYYIGELKIAGKFDEQWELGIGVRNDQPKLLSLLDKVIETINTGNQQEILNKWVAVKYEKSMDYALITQIVVFFLAVIILIIIRNTQLKKYNEKIESQSKKLSETNDELHITKQQLEKSLKSTEVLFDCVLDAVFVFDSQICIDVNDAAVKIMGYNSKDEMRGLHIRHFSHPNSFQEVRRKFRQSTSVYESKALRKDGTSFPVLVKGSNVVLNDREVRISALVDISEVKKKEQLLTQQNKLAAMGEMIGNIAHQWRQPLNIVSTTVTGLKLQLEYGGFKQEDAVVELERLNNTVQHLSQTIDDFRNFFKQDKEKSTFSIKSLLEKNMHLLEGMLKSNQIELIYENVDNVTIHNFENEFLQALLNIIYNAKDVLQNKETERYIFINVKKRENNWVELSIKDNGGGIAKNIIEHIFEPYFTTKHKSHGTGIGLYMTHQIIVTHMGGKIEVGNTKYYYNEKQYEGADFKIHLPL